MKVLRKPQQKDIAMPAPRYRGESHYAILCCVEISHVSSYKDRHNVSLFSLKSMMPAPLELTPAAKI